MFTRREALGFAAAAALMPRLALAQPQQPRVRPSWNDFRSGPQLDAFRSAIARLVSNTDRTDPDSMRFWADIHQFAPCPHGQDHFITWHRGYLALFERKLQQLSGLADLALPYWDYYTDPEIPAEFVQGTPATNPLNHERFNTDVRNALSLDPFAPAVTRFRRGETNAFEPKLESRPHNRVHSLIGADMTTMQSPRDPIFWLHHANIDRLTCAWAGGGGGRAMPPAGSSYWNGDFAYAVGLSAPKAATRDTETGFGYRYDRQAMPTQLPRPAPPRPPFRSFNPSFPLTVRPNFFSVGPSTPLSLGDESFSVRVPVARSLRSRLAPLMSDDAETPGAVTSLSVVLDGVTLTEAGQRGGYFYDVYLNLPASGSVPQERHLLGSVTPFEIATAAHSGHDGEPPDGGLRLVFPAADLLRELPPQDVSQLTVSFVRVEGEQAPAGTAVQVRDFRIEASSAPIE